MFCGETGFLAKTNGADVAIGFRNLVSAFSKAV
jgi:hypothetical protein